MATHKDRIDRDKANKAALDAAQAAWTTSHAQTAAEIHAAPGHSVVDAGVVPVLLYTSTDGVTYTTTGIGNITDVVSDAAADSVADGATSGTTSGVTSGTGETASVVSNPGVATDPNSRPAA